MDVAVFVGALEQRSWFVGSSVDRRVGGCRRAPIEIPGVVVDIQHLDLIGPSMELHSRALHQLARSVVIAGFHTGFHRRGPDGMKPPGGDHPRRQALIAAVLPLSSPIFCATGRTHENRKGRSPGVVLHCDDAMATTPSVTPGAAGPGVADAAELRLAKVSAISGGTVSVHHPGSDNSSRFGKLVTVHFDGSARIIGARGRATTCSRSRASSAPARASATTTSSTSCSGRDGRRAGARGLEARRGASTASLAQDVACAAVGRLDDEAE